MTYAKTGDVYEGSFVNVNFDLFPLEKFLKNYKLLKKSCLKLKNEEVFFSNMVFLRNFSKGNWTKWDVKQGKYQVSLGSKINCAFSEGRIVMIEEF